MMHAHRVPESWLDVRLFCTSQKSDPACCKIFGSPKDAVLRLHEASPGQVNQTEPRLDPALLRQQTYSLASPFFLQPRCVCSLLADAVSIPMEGLCSQRSTVAFRLAVPAANEIVHKFQYINLPAHGIDSLRGGQLNAYTPADGRTFQTELVSNVVYASLLLQDMHILQC